MRSTPSARGVVQLKKHQTPLGDANTARLRDGSKNGSLTTIAPTVFRRYSTVTSRSTRVPGSMYAFSSVASAMYFLSTGDQAPVVACPTCRVCLYTGTPPRHAVIGISGGNRTC